MSRKKKKGCNPLVGVLVVGAVLLVALVLSLFTGKVMLQKWIQGDGLLALIRAKAETHLNAEVDIEEVKWEGMKAFAGKITARGYPEAAFSKLEFNAVRANLNGVKNQAFDIPHISVSQGYAEFSNDRIERPPAAEVPVTPVTSQSAVPGWLDSFVPNRTVIHEIVIGSATIDVKDDQGNIPVAIRETRGTINPDLETGVMKIKARNGNLLLSGAPPLTIRDSSLTFQGRNLFINDASFGVYEGGHISSQGEIAFEEKAMIDLELKVSGVDVKNVARDDWKNKVSGTVRGPVDVTGPSDRLIYRGTLHLEDGVLESIPILEQIGQYTRSKRFDRLVLNQAQADFVMDGELLELRNIQIESDGLTRIEGVLDKQGEALAGVLQVGVTPGTLRWIPGAEQSVFTEKRDGFVWTTMKLGGTTARISEDLSGRLMVAAAADLMNKLPGNLQDALKGMIGGGTTPPPQGQPSDGSTGEGEGDLTDRVKELMIEETGDTGKKLIDILTPFLGQ